MSLTDFIGKALSTGFNKPILFDVSFSLPTMDGESTKLFSLLCHSCTLPGWQLTTTQAKIAGIPFEVQHGVLFDMVQCQFYIDSKLDVLYELEKCKNLCIDVDNGTFLPRYAPDSGNRFVSGNVAINIYDIDNKTIVATYTLFNAFIKSVTSLSLSWSAVNSVQQARATISYEYYEISYPDPETQLEVVSPSNYTAVAEIYPNVASQISSDSESVFGDNVSNADNDDW